MIVCRDCGKKWTDENKFWDSVHIGELRRINSYMGEYVGLVAFRHMFGSQQCYQVLGRGKSSFLIVVPSFIDNFNSSPEEELIKYKKVLIDCGSMPLSLQDERLPISTLKSCNEIPAIDPVRVYQNN